MDYPMQDKAVTYAVQYRWPGTEWQIFHHSREYFTLGIVRDEMESMIEEEKIDFPDDPVRMEYRIIRITYEVV